MPPNVLPFSGERRTDARSYHGREESRAQPAASRHRPTVERAAQAFIRCNGWFGGHRGAGALAPVRVGCQMTTVLPWDTFLRTSSSPLPLYSPT